MSGTRQESNGQDGGGAHDKSVHGGNDGPFPAGGDLKDSVPEIPLDPAMLIAELAIGRALGSSGAVSRARASGAVPAVIRSKTASVSSNWIAASTDR
ncbi:hypothetical protein BHAOGJBA_6181 [Methylobacterium hispanicum]|uniref:Uncharacterized protein n=1 Tax=Methylobacterium hispanicum TaxID=270350 RepID=A0AAV5A0N9_9HYPH|nr:hypothetical protein BHAOGJBA_6181 [Methylobacterium hispanicum]